MPRALPLIALFGPTAVGKTALAIALADRLRADGDDPVAISADALQLYAGLEILTGAASERDQARLEHRLVGILRIDQTASAGDYARRAHAEIDSAIAAGRRPIVVGGTGLYLRAAIADLDLRPPPDPRLREHYRTRLENEGASALHQELAARSQSAAAMIAPTDAQRITRALELLDSGSPLPGAGQLFSIDTRLPTLLVALVLEREALYARIEQRIDTMLADGVQEEVCRAAGAGASASVRQAIGFEELLEGDIELMRRRTRRYAKRQLTWLRKLPGALRIDVGERPPEAIAEQIASQLAVVERSGIISNR